VTATRPSATPAAAGGRLRSQGLVPRRRARWSPVLALCLLVAAPWGSDALAATASPREVQRQLMLAEEAMDSARNLLARGEPRRARERLEEAEGLYRRILEGNPEQRDAAVGLSAVMYLARQHEEAIRFLLPFRERLPGDKDIAHQLGLHHFQAGQHGLAVPLLEEVAADEGRFDASWLLAVHYYRQAEWETGLAHAERYARAQPHDTRALGLLGTYYLKRERFSEAVTTLDRHLDAHPDNLAARINRANALFRMGDYDRAGAEYEALVEAHPERARVLYNLAAVRIKQRRCEDALPLLERFIELADHDATARYFRADCLLRLQRWAEARDAFEDAREGQDHNPWVFYGLSRVAASEGDLREALRHTERAAELGPSEWEIAGWTGTVLRRKGRPADALVWHDRALELAPGVANLHVERGHDLWGLARLDAALGAFETARELDPELASARRGVAAGRTARAVAARAEGDDAEARRHLAVALEVDPDYAPARTNLALVELDAGSYGAVLRVLDAGRDGADADQLAVRAFARLAQGDEAGASADADAARRGATELTALVRETEAHLAVRRGDWESAAEAFEEAWEQAPRAELEAARARAWLEVGLDRLARGDGAGARAALARAGRQRAGFSADDRATLDFANAALAVVTSAEPARASRALATLIGGRAYAGPRWAVAREVGQLYVAYGHLRANEPDRALALLDRLRGVEGAGAAAAAMARFARDLMARRAFNQQDYAGAATIWQALVGLDADDAASRSNLGAAELARGRGDAAEAHWRALAAEGQPAEAFFNLGVLADRRGQHREAYEHFRRYLQRGGAAADAVRERVEAKERVFGFKVDGS